MWKYYDRNEIDCQSIVHFVMQNATNFRIIYREFLTLLIFFFA